MNNQFINEFATIVEVSPEVLSPEFDLVNDSEWDSLAYISTIALVDKYFNIVLASDDLESVKTFSDLGNLVTKRAA